MEVLRTVLTIVLMAVSVLMIIVVLMQQSKETGMGAAFGGETSTLGSKGRAASKEAKLQKLTKILAIVMGVIAVGMVLF
ncbi:MAG: preprotein translocase subunit SecG [Clostridiales bacterium]|jgi:preprotein translocase subunit SecG|nr:preprotein translocase subunit SecG [Clostridiales bacterium]